MAAGLVTGLLLRALLPGLFDTHVERAADFFRKLGLGFLVLLAGPVTLALIGLTVVGLPVALIGGALYFAALYAGVVVVADLVGATLLDVDENWTGFALALLVGLSVLVVVTHLPIVGWLFRVLVAMLGVGLVAERAQRAWRTA